MIKQIKIKYHKNVKEENKLKKLSVGDWIDLRTLNDVDFIEGEAKLLNLGVAMELPEGYEALVIPRSSLFKKTGLMMANSVGLIDGSYCGDNDYWHFPAYATSNTHIPAGTRIAQFRIIKHQPTLQLIEVEMLNNADRGGFGSTDKRYN